MPANDKAYQREYMAEHNTPMQCSLCHGRFRKYFKKHHEQSKKHQHMVESTEGAIEHRAKLANVFKALKDRIKCLEEELELERTKNAERK
jgi:hypothetical protein